MDNKTLIVTVVTAIISAFVKEIASGLFSLGKSWSITQKLKTKVKQQFTLNKITVALNLCVIGTLIWNLYVTLSNLEPPVFNNFTKVEFNSKQLNCNNSA